MPGNEFITPSVIARLAYANLYNTTVASQLVFRDYDSDYNGTVGDTITVRKPAVFEADEYSRGSGIDVQDAEEDSFSVTLDTILDVSFAVTAEQLTLEVSDFNEQLVQPAVTAIAQDIDQRLLDAAIDDASPGYNITDTSPEGLIDARTFLTQNKVPLTQRYGVVGPELGGEWLKDDLFNRVDATGSTQGLVEASLGRKFGVDLYEVQGVEGENGVVFHRTAFALVSRALALPRGNSNSAVFGAEGFGLRVVQDYDIDKKQDVISIDLLIGLKTLDASRAVVIGTAS